MSGFESDDSTENDGTEYNSYYGFSSKDRQQAQFVREDNAKRDKRSKAAAEREEELHFPRGEVPKLSQLIVEQFDGEKAVTTQDTLVHYSVMCALSEMPIVQDMVESVYWSGNKQGEKFDISEIIARSADNIRAKFPTIVEKFDADEIKEIIGEEQYNKFYSAMEEERAAVKRLSIMRTGTVLEAQKIELDAEEVGVKTEEGLAIYPLRALLSGVKWADDVDKQNRERHLSDEEFYGVFNMTKEAFKGLDRYKQTQKKKDHRLW